jgi:hypothetical protein
VDCFEVDSYTATIYTNRRACNSKEKIVCLVPIGKTPIGVIESVASTLERDLGLRVQIVAPLPLPEFGFDESRQQHTANVIAQVARGSYLSVVGHPETLIVAITPVDIFLADRESWRFAFGGFFNTSPVPTGVVSTARLGLSTSTISSRTQKLVNKYVGLGFYHLALSDDPNDAMYNGVLSVQDLDRMADQFPLNR